MPDNRPAVYLEGDAVIYRASALGHCLRELWAARSNMGRQPIPRVVQQGMDEGTKLEPIILDMLQKDHQFIFEDGAQQVVELNLGAWNGKTLIVRGKLDQFGRPMHLSRSLPIDVKAFTEDDVEKAKAYGLAAFPRYEWQQSVYALGTKRKEVYMPIFHKGKWEIEFWSLWPIQPPYTLDQIRDRVLLVEEHYANGIMPDDCPGDFACPYPFLHDVKPTDDLPDGSELLVQARIKLGRRESIFHNAKQEIDKKLRDLLTEDVTYRFDGYTISVYANPKRFDTAKAKALLVEAEVDLEDYYIPGKGSQVRFTPPKARNDGEPQAGNPPDRR